MKRLGLIFLLTGCAVVPYTTEDGRVASERELAECKYDAKKAAAGASMSGGFGSSPMFRAASLEVDCMALKGYKRR